MSLHKTSKNAPITPFFDKRILYYIKLVLPYDCMVNAITFGIDEEIAILSAARNPACALGLQKQIGAIATGRYADFIICNSDYKNKKVYIAGKQV